MHVVTEVISLSDLLELFGRKVEYSFTFYCIKLLGEGFYFGHEEFTMVMIGA